MHLIKRFMIRLLWWQTGAYWTNNYKKTSSELWPYRRSRRNHWPQETLERPADAINDGKRIIITTLQKFPVIYEEVENTKGKRFAIIVDEAHSSQKPAVARRNCGLHWPTRKKHYESLQQLKKEKKRISWWGRLHLERDVDTRATLQFEFLRLHGHSKTPNLGDVRQAANARKLSWPFHIY